MKVVLQSKYSSQLKVWFSFWSFPIFSISPSPTSFFFFNCDLCLDSTSAIKLPWLALNYIMDWNKKKEVAKKVPKWLSDKKKEHCYLCKFSISIISSSFLACEVSKLSRLVPLFKGGKKSSCHAFESWERKNHKIHSFWRLLTLQIVILAFLLESIVAQFVFA